MNRNGDWQQAYLVHKNIDSLLIWEKHEPQPTSTAQLEQFECLTEMIVIKKFSQNYPYLRLPIGSIYPLVTI